MKFIRSEYLSKIIFNNSQKNGNSLFNITVNFNLFTIFYINGLSQ